MSNIRVKNSIFNIDINKINKNINKFDSIIEYPLSDNRYVLACTINDTNFFSKKYIK